MKNKQIHRSSGVTIIEVLFSIGIVITGLLGVAGLIMVAGTQMTQGLEADAMSNAGLNAIAEFETRNMQNPANLAWYKSDTKLSPPTSLFQLPDLYGTDSNGKRIASPSFCIDPYFIAQQFSDGKFDTSSYFPGGAPPKLKMKRVTLRNMPLALSREIFIAKDDLAFSTPASGTELPEQQWIREGLNGPELKRANRAAYSWLATLTPNRSRMHTEGLPPPNPSDPLPLSTNLEPTDHYLLSIVVFKNRVVTNSDPEERFFSIEFLADGLGGGKLGYSIPMQMVCTRGMAIGSCCPLVHKLITFIVGTGLRISKRKHKPRTWREMSSVLTVMRLYKGRTGAVQNGLKRILLRLRSFQE